MIVTLTLVRSRLSELAKFMELLSKLFEKVFSLSQFNLCSISCFYYQHSLILSRFAKQFRNLNRVLQHFASATRLSRQDNDKKNELSSEELSLDRINTKLLYLPSNKPSMSNTQWVTVLKPAAEVLTVLKIVMIWGLFKLDWRKFISVRLLYARGSTKSSQKIR